MRTNEAGIIVLLTSGLVTVKVTTDPSPDMANRLTLSYKRVESIS